MQEEELKVESLVVGDLQTNCYFLSEGEECIIIDAGAEGEKIAEHAEAGGYSVKYVLATHGHFDHVCGVQPLRQRAGSKFNIMSQDVEILKRAADDSLKFTGKRVEAPEPDGFINNSEYTVGDTVIRSIHTPGHTPGSVSFLAGNILFSGDTLFRGSIGRMDVGGSVEQMRTTIEVLKKLDDGIEVYPGHGPPTTMGEEKRNNPFLTYYRI